MNISFYIVSHPLEQNKRHLPVFPGKVSQQPVTPVIEVLMDDLQHFPALLCQVQLIQTPVIVADRPLDQV